MTSAPVSLPLGIPGYPRSLPPPRRRFLAAGLRERTRRTLRSAAEARRLDAVLLSGGLDSSITAACSANDRPLALCVLTANGMDRPYARLVAQHLGLPFRSLEVSLAEMLREVPEVARILRSFDPMTVRNSVIQYVGLKEARQEGMTSVGTGDGSDELFAGYSFMTSMPAAQLDAYRRHLAGIMRFSAQPMSQAMGLDAFSPFMQADVQKLALALDARALVRRWRGLFWGKWVLREAFRDDLPPQVTWRWKDPLQDGAGTSDLTSLLAELTSKAAFDEARAQAMERDGVVLRDPEQAEYYRAYRRNHPAPRALDSATRHRCPGCQGPMAEASRFCTTCGLYPIEPTRAGA